MSETDSLPKDIVGVPESERESLRRTLAGAWVATVNKMTEVLEGVCSYVFSRNALTEREKEKALGYAEDEVTPEEGVQTETLVEYGFNPDVDINASALREQIAKVVGLENEKILVEKSMQRTFRRAIVRISRLVAMSCVMATLMQADASSVKSADALPLFTEVPGSVIDTTAVPAAWPTETVTQEPKDSVTTTSTPTEVATATAEVVQRSYYRFGNIEFGPDDGTPGKPTFLFIESTEGNFVLFFVPKQFTEEDAKNADYDSWRLRYNIAFIDGRGATVQTIHSGSSRTWFGEKLRWPAERLREYIEEGDLGPEERIKRLANSITEVRFVQAEGIVDSQGINYADPRQVEELVAKVDANGGGMINPVFEEVGSFDIVRLDPEQTTALEKAFEEAGEAGRPVSLADYFPGEPKIEIGPGDVVVMFCGQAAAGERPDPRRPDNQQTRNFLVLHPN
jgi:hypothetical protein